MLKYSSFRDFPFNEIDHSTNINISQSKSGYNKYQQYIDKLDDYNGGIYYIDYIRILKNFYNEESFIIKSKHRLNQEIIRKMIMSIEQNFDIITVVESWLGERFINDDNLNDGRIEWFIKLKEKIYLNHLDHIGGDYEHPIAGDNTVNFLYPTYTTESILRFDHIDNKYKIPINIVINGKLYDKTWYVSEKMNISINEIYLFMKYYLIKSEQLNNMYIGNIIMTNDGWFINLR
jgi:hypothetical protein